ncbi:MAG: hypothetical protein P8N30_13490 [Tateyamaria sp.]|nr:hypothetical protein [Tateyamaria sp.]
MNINQIINMITRIVLRKVINSGINAGIDRATRGGKATPPHPQSVEPQM